ncbi:MAG: 3-hydroxyacyl-ACP dehydratase FabZ [Firmicutes bacterium]|nr:3-hydroxyacyl-ACP dehydratase FabZ [Bacillota bacterium]
MLDIPEIWRRLPHRYPFLLVDRVTELEEGKRAVGIKNVTANEPFFSGHYPGRPIMPGVLIVECLAQVAGIVLFSNLGVKGKIPLFGGIDKARFRRMVVPGDQLRIEVEVLKARGGSGKVVGKAFVENELAAEAELLFFAGPEA